MTDGFGDPLDAPTDNGQLGAAAKRLLEDPVLALAFEKVECDLIETWQNSTPQEREKRDACYYMLWALGQVKARLQIFVNNRSMILAEAARKEAEAKRQAERRERYL